MDGGRIPKQPFIIQEEILTVRGKRLEIQTGTGRFSKPWSEDGDNDRFPLLR
jgi:hypothetical protein